VDKPRHPPPEDVGASKMTIDSNVVVEPRLEVFIMKQDDSQVHIGTNRNIWLVKDIIASPTSDDSKLVEVVEQPCLA